MRLPRHRHDRCQRDIDQRLRPRRRSTVPASSHNFRVIVAEEAVGDRSRTAHRANLFDMDMKMADVEPLEFIVKELQQRYGAGSRALTAE